MKNWIISIVVFVLSFAVTAFVGFYAAIFLVGPHADVLPEILQIPAGILLLSVIFGLPAWLSFKTFMRLKRK